MTVGKTRTAGWQIGVSRTVPMPPEQVWRFLLGEGLPLWLGVDELGGVAEPYSGRVATGEVRSRTANVRVRVTYQRLEEEHQTTVQIGLRPVTRGTTIVFHQERMLDAAERERARAHWSAIAQRVTEALAPHGEPSGGGARQPMVIRTVPGPPRAAPPPPDHGPSP